MLSIYSAPKSFLFPLAILGTSFAAASVWMRPSFAQSITVSGDTQTQVTQVGDRYDIQGSTP